MCTQFCHILFYFLCTYVLNLLLFLFSTLYTRSNPGFTFTFLFLLITSSELGKMFGYSSHTTHGRRPMIHRIHRCTTIQLVVVQNTHTIHSRAEGSLPPGKIFLEACQILQIYVTQTFFSRDTKVSNKMGLPQMPEGGIAGGAI